MSGADSSKSPRICRFGGRFWHVKPARSGRDLLKTQCLLLEAERTSVVRAVCFWFWPLTDLGGATIDIRFES